MTMLPVARMRLTLAPTPPPFLEILAALVISRKILSKLSSRATMKQEVKDPLGTLRFAKIGVAKETLREAIAS